MFPSLEKDPWPPAIHQDLRETLSWESTPQRNTICTVARSILLTQTSWHGSSFVKTLQSSSHCIPLPDSREPLVLWEANIFVSFCSACLSGLTSLLTSFPQTRICPATPHLRTSALALLLPHNFEPLLPSPHWELEETSQPHIVSPWTPYILPFTLPHFIFFLVLTHPGNSFSYLFNCTSCVSWHVTVNGLNTASLLFPVITTAPQIWKVVHEYMINDSLPNILDASIKF